MNSTLKISKYI